MGDPRLAEPGLRHPPARDLLHRQPAARGRATGHRHGYGRHGRAAAPDLRGDAASQSRHRGRHGRHQRRPGRSGTRRGGGRRRPGPGGRVAARLTTEPVQHPACAAAGPGPAPRHRRGAAMNTGSGAFTAGLLLLAVAAAWDVVLGTARARLLPVPYLLGAVASACLVTAGGAALAGRAVVLPARGLLGPGTVRPAADPLSALFLVIAFGAAVAVSLALASWAAGPG